MPSNEFVGNIFRLLSLKNGRAPTADDLAGAIRLAGLDSSDARNQKTNHNLDRLGPRKRISTERFTQALTVEEVTLVHRALSGDLVVPDFPAFTDTCAALLEQRRSQTWGAVASYIPQLARANPELYAWESGSIHSSVRATAKAGRFIQRGLGVIGECSG